MRRELSDRNNDSTLRRTDGAFDAEFKQALKDVTRGVTSERLESAQAELDVAAERLQSKLDTILGW